MFGFGQFPQLFDRNFVVAYFLPGLLITLMTGFYVWQFDAQLLVHVPASKDPLQFSAALTVVVATIAVIAWVVGILLLALNWLLYRALEGYLPDWVLRLPPFSGLKKRQVARYRSLMIELGEVGQELEQMRGTKEEARLQARYNKLAGRVSDEFAPWPEESTQAGAQGQGDANKQFPEDPAWVLPTSFGNAMAAWERYSKYMYGFDNQSGWHRMLGVIPKDYRDMMYSDKAEADFWVNIFWVALACAVEYAAFAWYYLAVPAIWMPLVLLGLAWVARSNAVLAVTHWGYFVRASYDLYLGDLGEKLGFTSLLEGKGTCEKWELWDKYSQAIGYRVREVLPVSIDPSRAIISIKE